MAKLRFPEQVGTNGNDNLRSGSNQLTFGLNGDDVITADSWSEYSIMAGGEGNDRYVAGYGSAITIVDTGGSDAVVAEGIGAYNFNTYVATINSEHLIAADFNTGQQIAIANWQSEGAIETYQLADGTYSRSQIEGFMETSPNNLGDVSVQDLVSEGVLPVGTSEDDLNELLGYITTRGSELSRALQSSQEKTPSPKNAEVAGLDDEYYLQNNPDIAAAGVDPDVHFANYGWKEGRAPNSWFDRDFYLRQNPDIEKAGVIPVEHYAKYGWQEGRDPNAWFDIDWYLSENPDIDAANIEPVKHFADYGWKEGRDPNQWFDLDWYLSQNQDIAEAGINPVHHYWDYGWQEGRQPSEAFDPAAYLEANPDIALAGVNPLEHWILYGQDEGRLVG